MLVPNGTNTAGTGGAAVKPCDEKAPVIGLFGVMEGAFQNYAAIQDVSKIEQVLIKQLPKMLIINYLYFGVNFANRIKRDPPFSI